MRRCSMRHGLGMAAAAAMAVIAGLSGASVEAGTRAATASTGYDISYPQCGKPFPKAPAFGVVGVNGGRVYSANPCLGTGDGPSELAWASAAANRTPAFYANTADPGPLVSSHWPLGQSSPMECSSAAPDSAACSYDYGWNAAGDSYRDAVVAEEQLYGTSAPPPNGPWWLDVETGNSWETLEYGSAPAYAANDTASVQGAIGYLQSQSVAAVGVYSTAPQWDQITGGAALGSSIADWVAGAAGAAQAASFCSPAYSFSGGPVRLTQYPSGRFDADLSCV